MCELKKIHFLFIMLLFKLDAHTLKQKDISKRSEVRKVRSECMDSFKKLFANIFSFFSIPTEKIERRRLKIKKAFFKFIHEAFESEDLNVTFRRTSNDNKQNFQSITPKRKHFLYHLGI